MELPAYHVPAWGNVLRATWERGWSFIKRAGTVILTATIILWFLQGFGFENGAFTMVEDQDNSILASRCKRNFLDLCIPQGFGNWRATVASISGLIAKENVVGTFGVLYHYRLTSCLTTATRSGPRLLPASPRSPLTAS